MKMTLSPLALLAAVLLGVGCAGPTATAETIVDATEKVADATPEIPVDDVEIVKAKIAAGAIVIDVRPASFASEKPVSAPNIPFDQVEARIEEINSLVGGDPSTPVVAVCGNGSKAVTVREYLKAKGFTEVYAQSVGAVDLPAPTP